MAACIVAYSRLVEVISRWLMSEWRVGVTKLFKREKKVR